MDILELSNRLSRAVHDRIHIVRALGLANKTSWNLLLSRLSRSRSLRVNVKGVDFTVLEQEYQTFSEIFIAGEYTSCLDVSNHVAPKFIIDLGGNVGFGTLFFKMYWPNAPTYVFEPIPAIFARLKENVGDVFAVEIHNQSVGCYEGKRMFVVNGSSSSSENLRGTDRDMCIECDQIDILDFIDKLDCDTNGLLKIDIEGGEWNLLCDNRFYVLLSKFNTVIIEVHQFDGKSIYEFENVYISKLGDCGLTTKKVREVPNWAAVYACWRA